MAFSNYLANAVLDEIYNQSEFTAPSNIYLALYTADPGDDDTGTEVSATNYSRVEVTADFEAAGATADREVNNDAEIEFAEAQESWGTVTHIGIRDAATGGNLLDHGALDNSKAIEAGDKPIFKVGEITGSLT